MNKQATNKRQMKAYLRAIQALQMKYAYKADTMLNVQTVKKAISLIGIAIYPVDPRAGEAVNIGTPKKPSYKHDSFYLYQCYSLEKNNKILKAIEDYFNKSDED